MQLRRCLKHCVALLCNTCETFFTLSLISYPIGIGSLEPCIENVAKLYLVTEKWPAFHEHVNLALFLNHFFFLLAFAQT